MIRTAITRRVSTAILALGLAIFGALNLRTLPVDFLPSVKYPLIKLSIVWPGATPDDIDRNLADPIERRMASVDGLDYLTSSALEGLYQLDVNYRYGVNVDVAYQDTLAAFARSQKNLPPDIDPPVIIKADPSQLPIVQVAFESDRMDLTQLRTWVDNWLTDRLLAAGGVAAVDVAGGLEREIRILLDAGKLEKHGLSLELVERRLREENVQRLGGRVTGPNRETIVRTLGEFTDLETIRQIVLVRGEGSARIRLSDVGSVEDSHEEVRLITRLDGRPAVKANIIKQADANTVVTVRNVERRLTELAPAFPSGLSYKLLENQADYITDSMKGVRNTALEALALVILVLFIFLGSPRQVLIIGLALPFALLVNFFIMLFTLANDIAARLRQRPELANIYVSLDYSKPEWQVEIDRTRAAEHGLTVAAIAGTLRGYIGGDVPTRYREASDLYDLRVLVPERSLRSRSDVEDLVVTTPAGDHVRLREVANVRSATGPVEIVRQNQIKQVIVRCDPLNVDLSTAQTATRAALAEVTWPLGYNYSIGGKARQMAEMQGVVKSILGLAVFFSFIVLAAQFNSLRLPLVILIAAPFCLTGMGYGLWIAGQPFGATVIIAAMIVLAANVIDGVLLIETAEHQRAEGKPLLEATLGAGLSRLRPRLMTVLPAVLGFTPLAFALEEGGELLRPMAAAAIGGLLLNVFVALFLVPVLYTWMARRKVSAAQTPAASNPPSS